MTWQDSRVRVLERAWQGLAARPADPSGFRGLATLATTDADGAPQLRTVAIRAADPVAGTIDIHTDTLTPKIREITADNRVAVLQWIAADQLQLRLDGHARLLPPDEQRQMWQEMPQASRSNYGVTPPPGTPIAAPDAYRRQPDAARFAVIRVLVSAIEAVHLGEPQHIRAVFERRDGWRGRWLAP